MAGVSVSWAIVVLLALGTGVAGCGDEPQGSLEAPASGGGAGPEHVHGLGVNPKDGALMIATHSGLFRAAAGSRSAARVGEERQDTMGFTVVGPDRFLGSGHPDPRKQLPPLLGLIRSQDAGRTWMPISLLGRADFHVLRSTGTRVYGVNASDGLLLVSDDGGRSWSTRTPPAALFDLVPAPGRPDLAVAASESGLFVTRDAGRSWRPMDGKTTGYLTWAKRDALYLVDGDGRVRISADAGASWKERGRIGGEPAAFAGDLTDLYVALHTNEVKVSTDGGVRWRTRVRP